MTEKEARDIVTAFDENSCPDEADIFAFTESMNFLIDKNHDPKDMMWLGGYYYEIKRFDLALKYYEMAAAMDYPPAFNCLGYIWYYGRTGERDYKKAFEYFSRLKDSGDLVAEYKVADMYKNGYYVEKDYEKYKQIIEGMYDKVKGCHYVNEPLPEVFTRLADIRTREGKTEDAINLYIKAKRFLGQRIKYNAFFGNLNIMKWLVDNLYELMEFDPDFMDLFDLYYLLKTPHRIVFEYEGKEQTVESVQEGSTCSVNFNGKWFPGRDEFFKNASIDGKALTSLYSELDFFEVIE